MEHWQVWLYIAVVLLPLASFTVQILGMRILGNKNAYVATATIATCFGLSAFGLFSYIVTGPGISAFTGLHAHHDEHGSGSDASHGSGGHDDHAPAAAHPADSDAPAADHKAADKHDTHAPTGNHSEKPKGEGGGSSEGGESGSAHGGKLVWKAEYIWTALGGSLGQPLTLSLGVYVDLLAALMFA
ncbi:MAG: hypothetical protein ACKO85_07055, partial [Isosphaeraceae bacterium]